MAADYTRANELGEEAHKHYVALKSGMKGQVTPDRRATLEADWKAAHKMWWDELDRQAKA